MTGRPGASLSASKPVTKSPSRLFLWSQRRVQLAWGIRVSGNPWRTFRVDPSRVDTVQHVEQIDGIGRIRAVAPKLDQQRAQIVPIASEPRTGASPVIGSAVPITLLRLDLKSTRLNSGHTCA